MNNIYCLNECFILSFTEIADFDHLSDHETKIQKKSLSSLKLT